MGRMYVILYSALKSEELSSSLKAGLQERRELSSSPSNPETKYQTSYVEI